MQNRLAAVLIATEEEIGQWLKRITQQERDPVQEVVGTGLDVVEFAPFAFSHHAIQVLAAMSQDAIPVRVAWRLIVLQIGWLDRAY